MNFFNINEISTSNPINNNFIGNLLIINSFFLNFNEKCIYFKDNGINLLIKTSFFHNIISNGEGGAIYLDNCGNFQLYKICGSFCFSLTAANHGQFCYSNTLSNSINSIYWSSIIYCPNTNSGDTRSSIFLNNGLNNFSYNNNSNNNINRWSIIQYYPTIISYFDFNTLINCFSRDHGAITLIKTTIYSKYCNFINNTQKGSTNGLFQYYDTNHFFENWYFKDNSIYLFYKISGSLIISQSIFKNSFYTQSIIIISSINFETNTFQLYHLNSFICFGNKLLNTLNYSKNHILSFFYLFLMFY